MSTGLDQARREQTVMMARIRNEERWIERCIERTWPIAKTVVLWDDGSDDRTCELAVRAWDPQMVFVQSEHVKTFVCESKSRVLHFVRSPFRPAAAAEFEVNEIRDKNALWEYVKAQVRGFRYVLCLDGDEMLSQAFLRNAPAWWDFMDDKHDIMNIPFVYLWDSDALRRVDGIYGDHPEQMGGYAKLNFPRLFTVQRWTSRQVFESHFDWQGTPGGFHCGSIPRAQAKDNMSGGVVRDPIVHFGYIDDPLRQRKFVFYNTIDPGNKFEGEYRHIIGEPDQHAPGPVKLVHWEDE